MRIGFVFIDGIGIGPRGPQNPFSSAGGTRLGFDADDLDGVRLRDLPPGWSGGAIDATLGVDGLPQSATGQTALLTGRNASVLLGHHQSAMPGATLRELLEAESLFGVLAAANVPVTFANAYGPSFFEHPRADRPPPRASATTVATWAAGLRFRTLEDLAAGEAVYHDLTRETLRKRGVETSVVAPEEAGRHLAALVRSHRFAFFEYFTSDLVGHGRMDLGADAVLDRLDRFLGAVERDLDPSEHGLVVTSDHGNLEDLSTRTHTRYPVPLLTWGRARSIFHDLPCDLTGVAPRIRRALLDPDGPSASVAGTL